MPLIPHSSVEELKRNLLEIVSAILLCSNLPLRYCSEALLTANHICSRVLHKGFLEKEIL